MKIMGECLTDFFGQFVHSQDLEKIIASSQLIHPEFSKQIIIEPGIYIVIAGKVRLLKQNNELINTLTTGSCFGGFNLFPEEKFQPYLAKASANLQLCFIPDQFLLPLFKKYPQFKQFLWQKAHDLDLLLIEPDRSNSTISSQIIKQTLINNHTKIDEAEFPASRNKYWWRHIFADYPFIAQQSASDCGAACLAMVCRYWGKKISINKIREMCNVDRNGASLGGLATTAENLGLASRPVKAGLNQLAEQILPAIAHWEGKHYLVVYQITRKHVIVCDPAIGKIKFTREEFVEKWQGYTLLLQPKNSWQETSEERSIWRFINLLTPHWLILSEIFIASVILQILGLVTPLLTQLILDRVVVQKSELTLTAVGFGLVIFGVFRLAISSLRQYLLDHTANRIDLSLIVGFIKHTFRLPLVFFESRYVGDIVSRVQENYKIQRFLTGEALTIILDLLTVFIYIGLMFWYSWKMALLTLAIVPPFFLLAAISTPLLKKNSRHIFNAKTEESSYLIQALTGIQTVKSMATENTIGWHWEELFIKSIKKSFSGQMLANTLQTCSNAIETLMTTGLLWFGAYLVIHNELTIGQLVAFNMLLSNVITPFRRLSILWNQFQEVAISIERLQDVIQTKPEENETERQFLSSLQGNIRFQGVTFRYHPEGKNILENVSFIVKSGQMVALVGRSGSGKTTIAKLILGLYRVTEGKIIVDGFDIKTLSLRSLRQQIGVVDQDTFLLGGTIRENISISNPEASLVEIIAAAEMAGAHSFIQEMPLGYETQIGEGGGLLSGGQRQRIAIARALLGNPRLLILDEATSHLDAESERIIQDNLQSILKNRTTFVIAHRLSTIRSADLILVLDAGVLLECGTHQELIQQRGHYFYLNQQQLNVAV